MIKLYRISSKRYIQDLSGTGAKLHGGRWNNKGTSMLYCSENVSLATLEILVHFDGLTVPPNLELLTLRIPEDEIKEFSIVKFNSIRKSNNAEYIFKEEGEKWIKSMSSLALRVPSIITLSESNVLVNPLHSNFSKLKKVKTENLELDSRLFKM